MRWASAVSDNPSLEQAVNACVESVSPAMEGVTPDLAVVFVSPHFAPDYHRVPELVGEQLGPGLIFGCSANGIIGGGHEVEHRPGVALTVAHLPDVAITPFSVEDEALPGPDAGPEQWEALVQTSRAQHPHFVIVADPFSLRAEELLAGLDYAFPESIKIGGLASGGVNAGANALYLARQVRRAGAIGVALSGNIGIDTVVAQGCKPIGQPLRITKCHRNWLVHLDGRPAMEVLQELYATLDDRDQALVQQGLFLGIVMDELQEEYKLGDFLIRNLVGIDQESGAIALGQLLRENQTVQFHLRDARTSGEDLRAMLAQYLAEHDPAQAEGALLFSCLGRGSYLYGRADHDTELFREALGPLPLGGFFCNGEIGQVGETTYLHGYTSSFGIFRPLWPK